MQTMTESNQPLVLKREVQVISEVFGHVFECIKQNGIPAALEQLIEAGYRPVTLPELVRAKVNDQDDRLWNKGYTTASEEDVGPNPKRIKIKTADPIYALAHGKAALLSSPQRVRTALCKEGGLTPQYAARFSQDELNRVLTGHERTFPFSHSMNFQKPRNCLLYRQTIDYVVVHPFAAMQETVPGYQT